MNLGMFLAPAPLGDVFKGTFAGAGGMLKNIAIKFFNWGFCYYFNCWCYSLFCL